VTAVAGVAALLGGASFAFLAVVSVSELLRRRSRPASSARFGLAFLLVSLTAAPYLASFGVRLLTDADSVPGALVIASAMPLLPLLLFAGLRIEAQTGARGERFIPGIPTWLPAVPLTWATVAGAVGWIALGDARASGVDALALGVEVLVLLLSLAVGSVLLHAQVERRRLLGGWSMSALSLTALFPAFGFFHAMSGLLARPGDIELALAALAVPAALYFLWVVRRLQGTLTPSTRKRPLVGPAARTTRESPWASPGADPSAA
jgi:hypothetical protein